MKNKTKKVLIGWVDTTDNEENRFVNISTNKSVQIAKDLGYNIIAESVEEKIYFFVMVKNHRELNDLCKAFISAFLNDEE